MEQNLLQFLRFRSIHLRRLKPLRRISLISRSPQVLATTTSTNTRTLQMFLIQRVPCCLPCRHQTTNWSTRNHLSSLGAMRTSRLLTHTNLLIQLISSMSLIWLSWKSVSFNCLCGLFQFFCDHLDLVVNDEFIVIHILLWSCRTKCWCLFHLPMMYRAVLSVSYLWNHASHFFILFLSSCQLSKLYLYNYHLISTIRIFNFWDAFGVRR